VWRVEGRYGAGYVAAVVRGEASDSKQQERITRSGHEKLTVWGLLKDLPESTVRAWIDQLVVQGHLAIVEDGDYALLQVADAGRLLCKGEGTVRLGLHAAKPQRKSRSSGLSATLPPDMDQVLFERLRTLRKLLAEKHQVAPYMIFHDATLHQLAALKPSELAAMRAIKGVGESKLAHYGAAFLAVVQGMDPNVVAERK